MDIRRVNYVLERAIVAFQGQEIEALWEKFSVPSPMQMHKKTGMAIEISAEDAMKGVDAALAPLTSGHGKLTDSNRTPNTKETAAALNDFIQVAKGMKPGERKKALARLRGWQKTARAHAKRLQGAAHSPRVGDVGTNDLSPARNVRDNITKVIGIVAKYRGGGFGKKQTTAKPGTRKKRPSKRSTSGVPSMMDLLKKTPQEIQKELQNKAAARAGGSTVADGTVETFLRVLEASLYSPDSFYERRDVKKRMQAVRSRMKTDLGSDDKRDLKDLIKVVKQGFTAKFGSTTVLPDEVHDWIDQVQDFIRSGRFPKVPAGTMVTPKRNKRQMAMKFEAIQRLKLALAG